MDAAPAGDADDAAIGPAIESGRARQRWPLFAGTGLAATAAFVVMVLVLIASLVVIGVVYPKVKAHDRLDDNRRDALTAAEQFALRMDALDASNLDAYEKSIEPLLTTKEKAEFRQQLDQFRQLLQQTQKSGKSTTPHGKIQLAGVADADSDSANILVAHDSSGGSAGETLHSRWTLGMRKVGGTWLVDSFVPVS